MSDVAGEARIEGMWLLRGDEVLANAEVAATFLARARGLLGRSSYEGVLVLPGTHSVHTMGMRFPIDVAFLDRDLVVVDSVSLVPWRMARPRVRCSSVLEAQAGAFERWRLKPGDQLELRRVS